MTVEPTAGELIGEAIRNRPELKRNPRKLADYLVAEHKLQWRDAAQIALRIANEPQWQEFPPIRQVELILTQGCNLRCDYCFVGEQSGHLMSRKTARRAIDFLIRQSGELSEVHVTFFGGEPMLAWRCIQGSVVYGEQVAAAASKTITWGMTTNGTLIDEPVLAFFREHGLRFLLSIDGDKATQDAHRRMKNGESSYCALEGRFPLMKRYQEWMGARITVMPDTAHHLSGNFKHLISKGFNQFIIEPAEGIAWPPHVCQVYTDQMLEMAKYYYRNKDSQKLRIDVFDKQMGESDKQDKTYRRGCWAGKSSVAITPDGLIYPCSKFIDPTSSFPPFVLGTVEEGMTDVEKRQAMKPFPLRSGCYECEWVFDCSGGCPANNFLETGDPALTGQQQCDQNRMQSGMRSAVGTYFRTLD